MPYKLVLLRHGQSAWNKTNQFTGWVDVPRTEQGEAEAKRGGELLKEMCIRDRWWTMQIGMSRVLRDGGFAMCTGLSSLVQGRFCVM